MGENIPAATPVVKSEQTSAEGLETRKVSEEDFQWLKDAAQVSASCVKGYGSKLRIIKPHELAMNSRHDCFAGIPAEVHNFKALTINNGPILWLMSSLLYGAMLPDQDMSESLW